MRLSNLMGRRFGRLVVRERAPNQRGRAVWWCDCDCGNNHVPVIGHELGKRTNSCGCLKRESTIQRFTTHGMSNTPEWRAFHAAKNRCTNPNFKQFKDYGGRGILFLYNNFSEFLVDVGRRPSAQHSLGRKENNGNYEPGNCRWETAEQQYRNRSIVVVSQADLRQWFGEIEGERVWQTIRTNYLIK